MSGDAPVDVSAARERVLSTHRGTLAAVLDAADSVAGEWQREWTGDPAAVSGPLSAALADRGLDRRLVALLVDAVEAAGRTLPADPVPAPPYLAVTSRGPVCRGTLPDGRLLVGVRAFRVERADGRAGATRGVRYVRGGGDPAAVLDVTFAAARDRGEGR